MKISVSTNMYSGGICFYWGEYSIWNSLPRNGKLMSTRSNRGEKTFLSLTLECVDVPSAIQQKPYPIDGYHLFICGPNLVVFWLRTFLFHWVFKFLFARNMFNCWNRFVLVAILCPYMSYPGGKPPWITPLFGRIENVHLLQSNFETYQSRNLPNYTFDVTY